MKPTKAELKKAKNLLNRYAPKGEELAYINSKEAKLLKRIGGAVKILMEQVLKVITDQMIMVLEKMVKEVADLVRGGGEVILQTEFYRSS